MIKEELDIAQTAKQYAQVAVRAYAHAFDEARRLRMDARGYTDSPVDIDADLIAQTAMEATVQEYLERRNA